MQPCAHDSQRISIQYPSMGLDIQMFTCNLMAPLIIYTLQLDSTLDSDERLNLTGEELRSLG